MNKIVSIPEGNVPAFELKMNKLVKVSKKLKSGDVSYNLISREIKPVKDGNNTLHIMFFNYEINGETPTMNGYSLVAFLERQNTLNLITHIDKTIELPEGLSERANYCEHCNSNRTRKYLFIVQEIATGKMIQVGKSCVKDFTGGHQNPEWIADWYSFLSDIDELETDDLEGFRSSGRYTKYVESMKLLATSIFFTITEGYVKTMNGTELNPSTAEKALKFEKYTTEEEINNLGCYEIAEDVKNWIMNQNTSNDYMINLQTLIREEVVSTRKAGFLASAYSSYQRAMGKVQEQKRVSEIKKESEFVGEVGKRSEYTLTFDRKIAYDTDFGTTRIYFFHDDNDNVFLWKTGSFINNITEGDMVTLKGTLKEHSVYNGVKQNVLSRCVNINAISSIAV